MRDVYESQAKFFSNIPLLTKGCVASVHLENKEDKEFWIKRLQRVHPGNYYIISQSRSKNGNLTSGCEQCLNYRGHLSKGSLLPLTATYAMFPVIWKASMPRIS